MVQARFCNSMVQLSCITEFRGIFQLYHEFRDTTQLYQGWLYIGWGYNGQCSTNNRRCVISVHESISTNISIEEMHILPSVYPNVILRSIAPTISDTFVTFMLLTAIQDINGCADQFSTEPSYPDENQFSQPKKRKPTTNQSINTTTMVNYCE